jgi:hypothetical protein
MGSWDWRLFPEAEELLRHELEAIRRDARSVHEILERIESGTSTRLIDWIDHLVLPETRVSERDLVAAGFTKIKGDAPAERTLFVVRDSNLPPVLIHDEDSRELALKVERLEDFREANVRGKEIEGKQGAPFRRLAVRQEEGVMLVAVERRGYAGYQMQRNDDLDQYAEAMQFFRTRPRRHERDDRGLVMLQRDAEIATRELAVSRAADAFFRSEREFWLTRNRAGKVQKARQDAFGLGWGNQDHHTFRSSRANFKALIEFFHILGMDQRERFYAGEMAGWGAQILEQREGGTTVFADVDLGPGERDLDFAREGLADMESLGTVGLWVGLHGESIFQAGMHHLAVATDFEAARIGLEKEGVAMRKPFSDFPFLRQAFTEGETWHPEEVRTQLLLGSKRITEEQYAKFLNVGAIGSHLESIQRGQGFKGFNQDSVSVIIHETDPRLAFEQGA